jgi:MFS family permease
VAGIAWIRHERRAEYPLVDLSLLGRRAVAVTNVAALFMSAAIYTFLPVLTDFVQAPRSTGYGLGASVVLAGLMLLPFSVFSTGMSRVAARLGDRIGESWIIPIGSLVFAGTNVYVAASTHALWQAFVAMGLAGIGVGFTFAAMPGRIVRAVPPRETGSALGFYQVVRYVGFSFGSAASATILAGATPAHATLPERSGFTLALLMAGGLALVAAAISAWFGRPVEAATQSGRRDAHLAELEREVGEVSAAGLPLNTEESTLRVVLEDEGVTE